MLNSEKDIIGEWDALRAKLTCIEAAPLKPEHAEILYAHYENPFATAVRARFPLLPGLNIRPSILRKLWEFASCESRCRVDQDNPNFPYRYIVNGQKDVSDVPLEIASAAFELAIDWGKIGGVVIGRTFHSSNLEINLGPFKEELTAFIHADEHSWPGFAVTCRIGEELPTLKPVVAALECATSEQLALFQRAQIEEDPVDENPTILKKLFDDGLLTSIAPQGELALLSLSSMTMESEPKGTLHCSFPIRPEGRESGIRSGFLRSFWVYSSQKYERIVAARREAQP